MQAGSMLSVAVAGPKIREKFKASGDGFDNFLAGRKNRVANRIYPLGNSLIRS